MASPVGISPALLQAISHLQKSRAQGGKPGEPTRITLDKGGSEHVIITTSGASDVSQFQLRTEGATHSSGGHILHGMNEPVTDLSQPEPEQTIYVMQGEEGAASMEVVETETYSQHEENPASPPSQMVNVTAAQTENVQVVTNGDRDDSSEGMTNENADRSDVNMGSVLSAIAKSLQQKQREVSEFMQDDIQAPLLIAQDGSNMKIPIGTVALSQQEIVSAESEQSQEDMGPPTPKRVHLAEAPIGSEAGVLQTHNGTAFFVNSKQFRVPPINLKPEPGTQLVYRTVTTEDGIAVQAQLVLDPSQMCPICGDKISGYHYGTYTCESCKGFFKRTVQNKKAFICHRKGECGITMANRKKCPACRFKLCLSHGMKVEAIREDRARGGRSSYEGCSPHGRPKIPGTYDPKEHVPRKILHIKEQQLNRPMVTSIGSNITVSTGMPLTPGGRVVVDSASPTVVAAMEHMSQIQPITPQLLEDLTAVESLMMEEDEEQACCAGKLQEGDTNMFGSLLHIADHCLYRIVRWARNLPDFANVSTDDQILLLQNCWAELLCICTCWNSIRTPQHLRLSYGRLLSMDTAQALGVGDLVERLLDFTEVMRTYELDAYEFVALKALLLLTPDVKNLKNEGVIRQQQEVVIDALTSYTTTHYPKCPEKFGRLLALLPQLSRSCILGKEQLNKRQEAGEVPPYSLLSELLKGDAAVA